MEFTEAIRRWTRQDDGPGKEPWPVVLARFDDLPEDYRLSICAKVTKIEQLHQRKARGRTSRDHRRCPAISSS
jgi:hypothetical protein